MRNILLLEPNYRNKYPPIGLMKISTYHKLLGDKVTFFKGDLKNLIIDQLYEECVSKLKRIDKNIPWKLKSNEIKTYIKKKENSVLESINFLDSEYSHLIEKCLIGYADYFRKKEYEANPKYDRIYVTTLFTFYWKITIETIEFAKKLVKSKDQLLIGGVMASLLTKEIETETGIKPITGLLDRPGILDRSTKAKNIIIDNLPLDYSILDEISYEYPTQSAYFTFMTKGCTRKCAFCSVPKLEPTYKPKIETIEKFNKVKKQFGEQQNLLLMDNNVLASPNFPEIIQEIKAMGFVKGATFIEPNQLKIAIRNLRSGYNDRAYINRSYKLIHSIFKKLRGRDKQDYYNVLEEWDLLKIETTTKENLLKANKIIGPFYEKYRTKAPRQRYVDFNQGTDARYVTDELMRLMSEIPIKPLRIAFDYLGLKNTYIKAVELAAKYGIHELSNYILYNFNDGPDELYERLRINVDLGERLSVAIYSFPMKYIPLFGEEAKDRDFIGKKWNRKFIRAVQSILNVTKGIVAPGRNFFEKAFGKDLNEFYHLLYMPETYIIYRKVFEEDFKLAGLWRQQFHDLMNSSDADFVRELIIKNDFKDITAKTRNPRILELMRHYNIKNDDIHDLGKEYRSLKRKFDNMIKNNQHHNLTLTYDFESDAPNQRSFASV